MTDRTAYIDLVDYDGQQLTDSKRNDIAFYTTSPDQKILIASGNNIASKLCITSNNIGIGTINPISTLEVSGDITSSTVNIPRLVIGRNYSTNILSTNFTSNANNIFYVDGNVGIGTTNPLYKLDINGITNIKSNLIVSGVTALSNSLQVLGSTALSNSLNVFGATALANNLNVLGGTALSNGLNVIGATALANNLNVFGGTALSNTLNVLGATALANNLNVVGGTALSNSLNVVGVSTFSNNISLVSGNIGIGTSNPAEKIHVLSNIVKMRLQSSATTNINSSLDFYNINGINGFIGYSNAQDLALNNSASAGALRFFTNNTERLSILNAGNIGIGTTNPQSALHVYGNLNSSSSASGVHIGFQGGSINRPGIEFAGTFDCIIDMTKGDGTDFGGRIYYRHDLNLMQFHTSGDTSKGLNISNTGNIGIGIINPASLLHVEGGSLSFGSAIRQVINLYGNGVSGGGNYGIGIQSNTCYFRSGGGNFSWFKSGIHSDTANDAGAGGTSIMALNPNGSLTINENFNAPFGSFIGINGFFTSASIQNGNLTCASATVNGNITATGNINSAQGYLCRAGTPGPNGGSVFNIQWNGSSAILWIDNQNRGTISVSSDYRIKQNIIDQSEDTINALDKIEKLRPIIFEYKTKGIFVEDGVKHHGFIAHEIQEVISDAADGTKDAIDQNGVEQYQNLNIAPIVSVLTLGIQELNKKNKMLQNDIELMKAENKSLKSKIDYLYSYLNINNDA